MKKIRENIKQIRIGSGLEMYKEKPVYKYALEFIEQYSPDKF